MRFWQRGRLGVAALAACALGASAGWAQKQAGKPARANELTLAGLRPGKDTLETAEKRYPNKTRHPSPTDMLLWMDLCIARQMSLDVNEAHVIRSIEVAIQGLEGKPGGDCSGDPLQANQWKTGKGLRLDDKKEKVLQLYGAPQSVSPSTEGGRELELMFYQFDWAGSDVPQVMEVTLERGRVVKILLAFESL